jgi:hypothetical protein
MARVVKTFFPESRLARAIDASRPLPRTEAPGATPIKREDTDAEPVPPADIASAPKRD